MGLEEDLADELVAEAGAKDADVGVVLVDAPDEVAEAEDPGVRVVGGGDGARDENGVDVGRVRVVARYDVPGREGGEVGGCDAGCGGGEAFDVLGAVVLSVEGLDGCYHDVGV